MFYISNMDVVLWDLFENLQLDILHLRIWVWHC